MSSKPSWIARQFAEGLAAFQLASVVLGLIGVGAAARWVSDVWLPFTRHVWTSLLELLGVVDITALTKDILTGFVFFSGVFWRALFLRGKLPVDLNDVEQIKYASILGFLLLVCVLYPGLAELGIDPNTFFTAIILTLTFAGIAAAISFVSNAPPYPKNAAFTSILATFPFQCFVAIMLSGDQQQAKEISHYIFSIFFIVLPFQLVCLTSPRAVYRVARLITYVLIAALAYSVMFFAYEYIDRLPG